MSDALATIPVYRGSRGSHDERQLTARRSRAKPKRVVVAPAQPSIEISGRVLAIMADYDGIWKAIRDRVDAMQVTRETLNGMANLQDGYMGKLLGGAQVKKFGKQSLGKTLGAIGCDLALIEDEIQTAKIRAIDQIIAAAAVALGISRTELASLAGFNAVPPRKGMSALDAALASAGCRLALVENSDARKDHGAVRTAKTTNAADTATDGPKCLNLIPSPQRPSLSTSAQPVCGCGPPRKNRPTPVRGRGLIGMGRSHEAQSPTRAAPCNSSAMVIRATSGRDKVSRRVRFPHRGNITSGVIKVYGIQ
jgi:hypothetical protein